MKLVLIKKTTATVSKSVPKDFLVQWLKLVSKQVALHTKFKISKYELVIVLVDEAESRALNKTYRKKNKPTDVLSFTSIEEGVLGELVICMPVIKKQAVEHGLSLRAELGYMILHGVLHLLGYDHESSNDDAKEMFGIQDAIFDSLMKK